MRHDMTGEDTVLGGLLDSTRVFSWTQMQV
jgi:hypothetical protein